MDIAYWTVIALHLLGAGLTILNIGKPRPVTSPGSALIAVILTALMIWTLTYFYQH